ncbi:hypothetical protein VNO78_21979 [Psophocarpus tetragonolobus]|uniref:Uncharacterized protein n=1 Tax=Psophocarpus tetragonolobus TaxID=3891 RepID=A0AAN9SG42_PSOTE
MPLVGSSDHSCLPLMGAANQARVVMLSSDLHCLPLVEGIEHTFVGGESVVDQLISCEETSQLVSQVAVHEDCIILVHGGAGYSHIEGSEYRSNEAKKCKSMEMARRGIGIGEEVRQGKGTGDVTS